MKKLILFIMVFALGLGLQAQDKVRTHKDGPRGGSKKFESLKIAHLTDALDLTPEVAEKFWPVYNKWNEQKKALRQANRPEKKIEDMTQVEAEAFIEKTLDSRKEVSAIDVSMHEELKTILSATQRMQLIKAEDNFHQSMVKRFKKKRKGKKERPNGLRKEEKAEE